MPLPTTPSITNVATSAWDAVSSGATSVGNFVSSGFNSATSSLNSTIDRLTGSAGSSGSLNGSTASSYVGMDGMSQADIDWELGSMDDTVTSSIPGGSALSSLSSVAGSLGGAASSILGGDIANGISSAASAIADAAGAVNSFVDKLKGSSLPPGAELFSSSGEKINLDIKTTEDWRVRVTTQFSYFNSPILAPLVETGGVVFPVLPEITLATSANYSNIEVTHNNYPFPAYKNSQVDDIQISGQFPAEREIDAAYWISAVTFFKTMTKMFFGKGEFAGNPPPVCYLYGYGTNVFEKIPVVVKNFSVDFPNDVSYIKCTAYGSTTWVPSLSTISISLQPIYNRSNMRKFNLQDYASGSMLSSSKVRYL